MDDGSRQPETRMAVRAGSAARAAVGGATPAVGDVIAGRYELTGELGRGGMGVVFAARDHELGRTVALKVARPLHGDAASGWEDQVRAECEALAAIDSRNIVTVHDVGRDGFGRYIVMELVRGRPLSDVIARVDRRVNAEGADLCGQRFDEALDLEVEPERERLIDPRSWQRTVARIMARALAALERAHERGIVHRDLKPSNLLVVGGGEPVILDFGLASSEHGADSDELRGTPNYLPPECVRDSRISRDPRADVYQMGLVLQELLTLQPAFRVSPTDSLASVLQRITSGLRSPLADAPQPPGAALAAIVARAVAVRPDDRYAGADQMRTDLERVARGLPPRHAEISPALAWSMRVRFGLRHPATLGAAVVGAAATAAFAFAPTSTAAAKIDPFLYRRGSDGPVALDRRATLELEEPALLGLEVTTGGPMHVYAIAAFGPSDEPSSQAVLPLRVTSFPPPSRVPEDPAGLAIERGKHRVACALLDGTHRYERLVAFACKERNAVLDAWLEELWVASERGRHPIGWSEAWQIGEELLVNSRAEGVAAFDASEHRAWFGNLQEPADHEVDRWEKAGALRFDFEYRIGAADAGGMGAPPSDPIARASRRASADTRAPPIDVAEPVAPVALPKFTGRRRAVLVGIDRYEGNGSSGSTRGDRRELGDLAGAVHDAVGLASLLESRFGFAAEDVMVLTDDAATRSEILGALRSHLVDASRPGDAALFFFAGHGSELRADGDEGLERIDQTLVPVDAAEGERDIWDKELKAVLNDLLDRGVHATAILDCCHSGGATRGITGEHRMRFVRGLDRAASEVYADIAVDDRGAPSLRGALVLAATQSDQAAVEVTDGDGLAHGLFSRCLLETLRTAPRSEPAERTFQRVEARMSLAGRRQQPVLAGLPEARRRGLLGPVQRGEGDSVLVGVAAVDAKSGEVELRAGAALGLGVGATLSLESEGGVVRLEVARVVDLDTSIARCVAGSVDDLEPADLLRLETFGTTQRSPLRVWWPPAVADASAAALDEDLPLSIATLPPPLGLVERIAPGWSGARSSVVVADEAADADYWLVGRLEGSALEYAWRRPWLAAEEPAGAPILPLRTDWVDVEDEDRAAAELRALALRLAKLQAWLLLEAPPGGGDLFPYRLALRDADSGAPLTGGVVRDGQRLQFHLVADGDDAQCERRFVFLFVLQSDGRSTLLFPRRGLGGEGNRFPPRDIDGTAALPTEIPIPHPGLTVSPPYGTDTYVLLTSRAQITDPFVLEGDPVRTPGERRSSASALEELVRTMGRATRSAVVVPDAWSIERLHLESRPVDDDSGG